MLVFLKHLQGMNLGLSKSRGPIFGSPYIQAFRIAGLSYGYPFVEPLPNPDSRG